jgi:hypothetical protein
MSVVRLETVNHPQRYSSEQIGRATRLAQFLDRGLLVLCEAPRGWLGND